jgi:hypothetical protein
VITIPRHLRSTYCTINSDQAPTDSGSSKTRPTGAPSSWVGTFSNDLPAWLGVESHNPCFRGGTTCVIDHGVFDDPEDKPPINRKSNDMFRKGAKEPNILASIPTSHRRTYITPLTTWYVHVPPNTKRLCRHCSLCVPLRYVCTQPNPTASSPPNPTAKPSKTLM